MHIQDPWSSNKCGSCLVYTSESFLTSSPGSSAAMIPTFFTFLGHTQYELLRLHVQCIFHYDCIIIIVGFTFTAIVEYKDPREAYGTTIVSHWCNIHLLNLFLV